MNPEGPPERYADRPEVKPTMVEGALSFIGSRLDDEPDWFTTTFPTPANSDLWYGETDNNRGGTESLWNRVLWLAYEATGESKYQDTAEIQVDLFHDRLDDGRLYIHDVGFFYTRSAVVAYRI